MFARITFFLILGLSSIGQSSTNIENPANIASSAIDQFETWLNKHSIKGGAIAVSYNGKLISSKGFNRDASTSAPVASLSKAITAVCVVKALEASGKDLSLTLGHALPEFFAKHKKADSRYKDVTVAQLITHNTGIHSRYHRKYLPKLSSFKKEKKTWQMSKVVAEKPAADPGSGYHYSNANYLALGLVIEALTKTDYESYCQTTVLEPIGINSGSLNAEWRILSSYGGWQISAIDYLTFVDHYFGGSAIMNKKPDSIAAYNSMGNGLFYSLGTLGRQADTGYNFWHAGSWSWKTKRIDAKFGAYFAAYSNGITVSVNYDHDAFDGQQADLDKVLYRAAHPR